MVGGNLFNHTTLKTFQKLEEPHTPDFQPTFGLNRNFLKSSTLK